MDNPLSLKTRSPGGLSAPSRTAQFPRSVRPGTPRLRTTLCAVLLTLVWAECISAQPSAKRPPPTGQQIEELLAQKARRSPAQRKVSSQLLDAAASAQQAGRDARRQASDADARDEVVTVDIRADVTPAVLALTNDPSPPAVTTCSGGMAGTYPCSNVDLMSFLALADIGGGEANDIWGWTDASTGKEYAIMGRTNGTSFVDISDPVNPIYLGNLPPHSADSEWRDIKVYADHAFMVTEAKNSGMQVFDLTQLRMVDSPPATFSETAHYPGFSDAHNLAINEDSGFAYAVGTNTCGGGLHMIDIHTPANPTSAGCFSADGYTHDAQCVNYDGPDLDHQGKEICFNSNLDTLTIVDVTNKAGPAMLSRTGYSGSRDTHQGWLTEDQVYFLLGDESDEADNPDVTNTRTYLWDVSDLDDPALIGSHDSTTTATDHNQYVKGSYTYQSNYRAGLRILDITDIANGNLTEVAFFDVYPGSDSPKEDGTWSNYPFFDSGIVIVSEIEQGLFVLRPNLVDGINPALSSAAVNGAALTLTYGEALDESSTPATDIFTVTVAGSGRTVTHVSVSGRAVTLTLASAVTAGQEVTVTYTVPGTNPIRDAAGNAAEGLSNDPARNATPDTTSPTVSMIEITSNPATSQTYGAGEAIEVTVTLDETVIVTGRPRLSLTVGAETKPATYDRGSNSDTLVFAYPVASGDSDTGGVSIEAGRIDLNSGTIQDGSDNDAELDHEAMPTQAGHKVDGIGPMLAATGGAVAHGTTLTLTYDEPLDARSIAEAGDFTVSGGDRARTVTGVRVDGSAVELTLDSGAGHREAGIQVSYTPGANPIQDAVGNDARPLTNRAVENNTRDTTAPVITTPSPILVPENETAVSTLTATDDTPSDQLTWTIPSGTNGGADAGQFTLSSAGDLTFAADPDYENPTDADRDNVYAVTVQVSDGTNTDMATLEVTVENVIELATEMTGPATVKYAENQAVRVATYIASSDEDRAGITWHLGGADKDHFSIDTPPGVLRFHIDPDADHSFPTLPDFEAPDDDDADNVYAVTVLAQADSVLTRHVTVTVTVTDENEAGTVTLSSTRPRLGVEVTATLSDPDEVSGTPAWQWERSAGRNTWEVIAGAEADSYTPVAADTGAYLRVTATYTDGHAAGQTAHAVSAEVVTAHTLSQLEVTTSSSRSMYPVFDPEILHYAVGCQDTLTLTLSTRETDTRLAVNGIQRANQNVVVELTGLAGGSDIPITLTGSEGASTTYVLHCLADDFPAIITEKKPGAWDGLITIGVPIANPRNPESYLAMIDNNGVPRIHWRIFARVRIFRTHRDGRYPYSYGKQSLTRNVIVLDENLEPVDTVTVVEPLHATDLHDFVVKSNGNYLLLAYEPARRDMSQFTNSDGNPYSTTELTRDSVIQEVTPDKEEAFNWNSWDYMAVEDCTQHRFPDDYAHVNSVQAFDDDIVASFRGCSKVLRIDGVSGDVIWRLGKSNRSDADWTASGTQPPLRIVGDPYGEFCGQHSARMIDNGNLLLFDNGVACLVDPEGNRTRPGEDFSRIVEYAIDPDHGEAIFQRHYSYHGEFNKLAPTQGHIELLETGNWLISWGSMPVNEQITEYSPLTGEEVLIIKLHVLGDSDRGLRTTAYPVEFVALADTPGPLTAEIVASAATSAFHTGSGTAQVVVAFSRPVKDFAAASPSLSVTGAEVTDVAPHIEAGAPANAYLVRLRPAGDGDITLSLVADDDGVCTADEICTADGTPLTPVRPTAHTIPGPVQVSFDEAAYTVTEGGTVEVVVKLNPAHGRSDDLEIRLEVLPVSTAAPADFSGPLHVTFGPTETTQTISLMAIDDPVVEAAETVVLAFAAPPSGVTAGDPATTTVTIPANDAPDPIPAIAIGAGPSGPEGSAAMFTLTRTGAPEVVAAELRVGVAVTESGAMLSGAPPTTVTFPQGVGSASLSVATVDDRVIEAASTVTATLHADTAMPPAYTVDSAAGTASVTVTDNDVAAFALTVMPSSVAEGDSARVTVALTNDVIFTEDQPLVLAFTGSATRTVDYTVGSDSLTLPVGQREVTTTVTTEDDSAKEPAETIEIVVQHEGQPVGRASLTIAASDAPLLTGAVVAPGGRTLTLTFQELLDTQSPPAAAAFTVTVDGVEMEVTQVEVTEHIVVLHLAGRVPPGQPVTVSYTDPTPADDPTALQNTIGNDADSFTDAVVENPRPPPPPPRPPSGGGGGPACAADVHGNSATQATGIALATETAGAICPAGDVDYFTVTAPDRGLLFVDTPGSVNLQGTLWQNEAVLASGPTGRGSDARLGALVEAGAVVVAVAGQGGATGDYELVITFRPGYLENPGPNSF